MPDLNFELKVGEQLISAKVSLPAEPIRPAELLPVLYQLNDALISTAVEKVEATGERITCRAGCACCRQLVPISETEAFYLADFVAALPQEQKQHVIARFAETVRKLADCGMLDRLKRGSPKPDELRQMGVEYFQLGIPCPFLENESCSIHPHRPSSCREYLVTSPAANCASPSADNIDKVALPTTLSRILYRFGDGIGLEPSRWLPLSLLLDWTAGRNRDMQPAIPGPRLFENFMKRVMHKTQSPDRGGSPRAQSEEKAEPKLDQRKE